MKFKKSTIIFFATIAIIAFGYTAIAGFFSQPTRAKGLVGHWSLSEEDEVYGNEILVNGDFSNGLDSWDNAVGINPYGTVTSGILTTDDGGWAQSFSTTSGKRYLWSADRKNGTSFACDIRGGTTSDGTEYFHSADVSTSWLQIYGTFYATAATSYITPRSSSNNGTCQWDNISVKEISTADLTPNENNGTVYGATYTTDRNEQSNKAMDFDGTGDYISLGDLSETEGDALSLFAWVKVEGTGGEGGVISKGNYYSGTSSWFFGVNAWGFDNRFGFSIKNDSVLFYNDFPSNQWVHVGVVYDKDNEIAKLYRDGVVIKDGLNGGSFISLPNTSIPIFIGNTDTNDYFDGQIQDARIYNRALTQTEITELYESYNPKIKVGAKRKGLVGEWSLGDTDEVMGSEILTGDDIDMDTVGNWTVYSAATVTGGYDSGDAGYDKTLRIEAGDALYDASELTGQFTLTDDKRYRLMFDYKNIETTGVSDPNPRLVGLFDGSDYLWRSTALSATWATIAWDFTADHAYNVLRFYATDNDSHADNEILIDNVFLREISAADLTIHANNGTIMGSTTNEIYTTDRNGQSNKAMTFSGIDSYINIDGIVADVANDTQGTWMAWVKPDEGQPAASQMLISMGDTDVNENIRMQILAGGEFYATARDGGIDQWAIDTDAAVWANGAGAWTHLVVVQDGISPLIYVNGVVPAQAFNITTDKTDWFASLTGVDNARIGSGNYDNLGNIAFFNGSISNVKIYNRALSASEILDIYDDYNPVIKQPSIVKGLVGHWSLSDKDEKLGDNILTNSDMEADSTWVTRLTPDIDEQSSEQAVSGTYSWKIVESATESTGAEQNVSVTAGRTYKASSMQKITSYDGAKDDDRPYYIRLFDNSDRTYIGGIYVGITGTTDWFYDERIITVPVGTTDLGVGLYSRQYPITVYYDDVFVKPLLAGDKTINVNDGAVYGPTYTTDRNGQSNKAMDFNGTSDYISRYVDGSSIDIQDEDFTLSAWIKLDSLDAYQDIIDNKYAINSNISGYSLHIFNDNTLRFVIADGGSNIIPYKAVVSTDTLTTDTWYHVAGLRSGDGIYVYINGELAGSNGSGATADIDSPYNLYIGRSQTSDAYFDGSISDIRIYNRALTAEEVKMLYEQY